MLPSNNLFAHIISIRSINFVLAPIRVTYSCPIGKHTVMRNVCSNGALWPAVGSGWIWFCGATNCKSFDDRLSVCDFDKLLAGAVEINKNFIPKRKMNVFLSIKFVFSFHSPCFSFLFFLPRNLFSEKNPPRLELMAFDLYVMRIQMLMENKTKNIYKFN